MRPGILLMILAAGFQSCMAQTDKTMEKTTNPLLCDPQTGMCEMPSNNSSTDNSGIKATEKPVKLIYFTDPICSSCWGIEPQLRKLKIEYGSDIEIEYHMGGLLPDWSYDSGGISKPSDVAHHWDEVSAYYQMPIDGDVWLEDPLNSSYPPSIAYRAAAMQDEERAHDFMREIREMVFLKKVNIAKYENLEAAAKTVGLDVAKFKEDFNGKAKELFEQDLALARKMGVRGFPTIFVTDATGKSETVYGSKPYSDYETAIKKLLPNGFKAAYAKDWKSLFAVYTSMTVREFSELSGKPDNDVKTELESLVKSGSLEKLDTKNGAMYSVK